MMRTIVQNVYIGQNQYVVIEHVFIVRIDQNIHGETKNERIFK